MANEFCKIIFHDLIYGHQIFVEKGLKVFYGPRIKLD